MIIRWRFWSSNKFFGWFK